LLRNCFLKQIIKERREDKSDGKGGRRHKKLLDDLKEKRGYCKLKEAAVDRTVWRTVFGRWCGPVVMQTT